MKDWERLDLGSYDDIKEWGSSSFAVSDNTVLLTSQGADISQNVLVLLKYFTLLSLCNNLKR